MAREITCKMLKTPSFSCFFHEILTLLGSGAAKWVKLNWAQGQSALIHAEYEKKHE